ncbi:Uncharacterised protein [Bordetella pertussis]|nr:Uncharacterised protein [Bordetella pertussis]
MQAGQGHVPGHGRAAKASGAAQYRRPEVDQLGEVDVPVVDMGVEDRSQLGVAPHFGVELVHQLRDVFFGTEIGRAHEASPAVYKMYL